MAVSGSYKVTFSPDLSEFKGIGDQIRKDLAKATSGLPADFDKMLKSIQDDLKKLSSNVDSKDIIDPKGFKGAGDEAGRDFAKGLDDEATKGASGLSEKLKGVLAGAGKAALVGVGAAAAGIGTLAFAGIKATAELEQNLGGAEAVFGDNADSIKKWAASAAGSMGQTTNEALATASKMGSLFQGAGHSAEDAAEMTMGYSQRAADVASIMGVDLSSAMEAVTGAAKGNYEMMDNLGVSMNETSLAAYAAEQGITKSWQSMSQAEKTGLAYQMFMDKTAQYAGNFEKENQTLAGSFDILKASWGNVITSMSDPEMLESSLATFSTSLQNFVGSVSEILPSIIQGVVTIIQEMLPILLTTLTELIPQLASMLTEGLPQIVDAVLEALPSLIDALLSALNELLPLVLQLIVDIVLKIVEMLPTIIESILELVTTMLPLILEAIGAIVIAIVEMLPSLIVVLVEALVGLIPVLIEGAIALFMALLQALPMVILEIVKALPSLISQIVIALVNAIPMIIEGGIQLFMGLLTALPEVILELVKALPQILESLINGLINAGSAIVEGLWEGIMDAWPQLMRAIGDLLSGLWEAFLDFFDINSPSKLMADTVGKNIGLGVGEGIEDSLGSALKSVDAFSSGIYAEFEDGTYEIIASSDMDSRAPVTNSRTVIQNISAQRPMNLRDQARAMRKGAVSGLQSIPE